MFKQCLMGAFLAATMWFAKAGELPAYPFVHVSGVGKTMVVPDRGEIDFEVTAQAASADQARALIDTRLAEIRALLEQVGMAASDMEVRDVRKDQVKNANKDAPRADEAGADPTQLKCTVHINVRELARWRDLLSPLLNMANLDGFAVAFDTTEREKIEAQLLADAMSDARIKAQSMLTGVGKKVGAVAGVTNGELKNMSRAMGLAAVEFRNYGGGSSAAVETDRASLLAIISIKMAQPVDVIFRIK